MRAAGTRRVSAARLHEHGRDHRRRRATAASRPRNRWCISNTSSGTTSARSISPSTRCCAPARPGSRSCSCTRRFPVGERDTAPTPTGRTIVEFLNGRIPAYVDTALNVVHVDDVARGHVLAAQRGAPGRSYILGGDNMSLQRDARDPRRRVRAPRATCPPLAVRRAADRAQRGVVPVDASCTASRRCRRSRCAWRRPAWSTTRAGPARELGYTSMPARTALMRAARWFVDNGFVKTVAGRADPPVRPARLQLVIDDDGIDRQAPETIASTEGADGGGPMNRAAGDRENPVRRRGAARRARSGSVRAARALHESADADDPAHDRFRRRLRARRGRVPLRPRRPPLPRLPLRLRRVRARPLPSRHRAGAARRDGSRRCRTSCRWNARRCRVCSRKRSSRACRTTTTAASSPTAAPSRWRPSIKYVRCATGRSRILFADHAFHGLTMGALSLNGAHEFRDRFGTLLPGCQSVPVRRPRRVAARARSRRRRRVRRRTDPGQGRVRRARGLSPGRGRALPPLRRAARDRRGADRPRAHGHVLRVRAVGASSPTS